jgi:hypothetical protein
MNSDSHSSFNFELVLTQLDLIDVDPNSHLAPGSCYFIRWMTAPGEIPKSWIGIICDDSMLPADFRATRPVDALQDGGDFGVLNKDTAYPVWLVGKGDAL